MQKTGDREAEKASENSLRAVFLMTREYQSEFTFMIASEMDGRATPRPTSRWLNSYSRARRRASTSPCETFHALVWLQPWLVLARTIRAVL